MVKLPIQKSKRKEQERRTIGGEIMINKLTAKIQKTKAPIVVGLDPMLNYIPNHYKIF